MGMAVKEDQFFNSNGVNFEKFTLNQSSKENTRFLVLSGCI